MPSDVMWEDRTNSRKWSRSGVYMHLHLLLVLLLTHALISPSVAQTSLSRTSTKVPPSGLARRGGGVNKGKGIAMLEGSI